MLAGMAGVSKPMRLLVVECVVAPCCRVWKNFSHLLGPAYIYMHERTGGTGLGDDRKLVAQHNYCEVSMMQGSQPPMNAGD